MPEADVGAVTVADGCTSVTVPPPPAGLMADGCVMTAYWTVPPPAPAAPTAPAGPAITAAVVVPAAFLAFRFRFRAAVAVMTGAPAVAAELDVKFRFTGEARTTV